MSRIPVDLAEVVAETRPLEIEAVVRKVPLCRVTVLEKGPRGETVSPAQIIVKRRPAGL